MVYEMNLTTPGEGRIQLIEVRARLQHLMLLLQGLLKETLVMIRYSHVTISKYIKSSLELRNVPYPINLTVMIPYARYSETLLYRGEESIKIWIREPRYNVYLKFYDALLRPLATHLVNVTGVKVAYVNETHLGLKSSREVKLKFKVYGIKVGEAHVIPPSNRFEVRVIEIKLPVGPLRIIAPINSRIKVTLPSGVTFTKECKNGEVIFEYLPACKLLLTVEKNDMKIERIVDFPGALTITIGFEWQLTPRVIPLLSYLPYIILALVTIVGVIIGVKVLERNRFKSLPRVKVRRKVGVRPKSKVDHSVKSVEEVKFNDRSVACVSEIEKFGEIEKWWSEVKGVKITKEEVMNLDLEGDLKGDLSSLIKKRKRLRQSRGK